MQNQLQKEQKNKQENQNIQQFLIFIKKNPDYIPNIYKTYFEKYQKASEYLVNIDQEQILSFLKQIYGFNKPPYTNQDLIEKINQSLYQSLSNFLFEHQQSPLDLKLIIELLKFCISNTNLMKVQYKDNKQIEDHLEKQEEVVQQKPQSKQEQKIRQQENQQQPSMEEQQTLKQETVNNIQPIYQNKKQKKQINEEVLKKKLKGVFQYYCKTQQNIGTNATFDRINHQASSMNLGKFLIFCNSNGITNDNLNKYVLMDKFKKAADGFKQIEFSKFFILIKQLKQVDEQLYDKIHLDSQKSRLQKSITKQKNSFQNNNEGPTKLTSHSGKTSQNLMEILADLKKARKQIRHIATPIPNPNLNNHNFRRNRKNEINEQINKLKNTQIKKQLNRFQSEKLNAPNLFNLNDLKQLKGDDQIKKLIIQQQQDQDWMNQYKILKNPPNTDRYTNNKANKNTQKYLNHSTDKQLQLGQIGGKYSNKSVSMIKQMKKRVIELSISENLKQQQNQLKLENIKQKYKRKIQSIRRK